MTITEKRVEKKVLLQVQGRIDVNSSGDLEKELNHALFLGVIDKVILDFSEVEYISSAGIRVLLSTQKKLPAGKELVIHNPSEFCKQVFEVTGADIFLTIN